MTRYLVICMILVGLLSSAARSGETEIEVLKGKVRGRTPESDLVISAGQKGVVKEGQELIVAVNDPLVQEAIQMYRWVEEQKAYGDPFKYASIWVAAVDDDQQVRVATLIEYKYDIPEAKSVITLGPTSAQKDLRVYDFEGNLLEYDEKPHSEFCSTYYIKFPRKIEPGETVRYITVSPSYEHFWWLSEGPVWSFSAGHGGKSPHLHHSKIILPKSAIVLGTYPEPFLTNEVQDRIALTFRSFTEDPGIYTTHISFLWPDKDGTTLLDIPPEIRGIQDPQQTEHLWEFREGHNAIMAGQRFSDLSTPMQSLLTCLSFIYHDLDQIEFIAQSVPFVKNLFGEDLDNTKKILGQIKAQIPNIDLHSCRIPEGESKHGDLAEFKFKLKGTFEPVATLEFMNMFGEWVPSSSDFLPPPPPSGKVTVSGTQSDLTAVTYRDLQAGQFIKRWLFLGPIDIPQDGESLFPDLSNTEGFFESDILNTTSFEPMVRLFENDYRWSLIESESGIFDLTSVFDKWYAAGFAWAQIEIPEETEAVLGIGSDDSVKVWLNGELVHKNWITRGVVADNDLVPVTFKKGMNQLVIHVQNDGGPWGFACRLLETK